MLRIQIKITNVFRYKISLMVTALILDIFNSILLLSFSLALSSKLPVGILLE